MAVCATRLYILGLVMHLMDFVGMMGAAHAPRNPLLGQRLPPWRGDAAPGDCGGACAGMAHYPVAPLNGTGATTDFYAEFDVPALPEKQDAPLTYYIYFNIFFGTSPPYGGMNQFPSQLILGDALDGSTGPPLYKPHFGHHSTWAFGAHYFFTVLNETSGRMEPHAAYGDLHETKAGEVLWTRYRLDSSYVWHLTMGVKGDPARTSTLLVERPYMGLLPDHFESWAAPRFDHCNVNSCWELYGMRDRAHYPGSGSRYDMRITQPASGTFQWMTNWTEDEQPHCGTAGPLSRIKESHNATEQDVWWDLYWGDDPYPPASTFPPSHELYI